MMEFAGKTVIVTGGGRGTGAGITAAFLAAGAEVIICGRREPDRLESVDGRAAHFISCDVRDPDQAAGLVDQAVARTGRLDVLINNAGGGPPMNAAEAPSRLTEAIIRLNLLAPIWCAQAACNAMRRTSGSGSIISIASVSAIRPSPGTAAYGAAKAGLVSLTRSLAMEWAPDIRVNAIIAGLIRTEAAADHYGGAEGIDRIERSLPMQRMASPSDIAGACLFLASDNAAYVSGAALEVHGGGEPLAFLSLARSDP
jgi:NAD(P)-dependent dehydrogenase (short-subunit alcohol dehydrogenase family)